MKKILSIVLSLVMVLGMVAFTGCGSSGEDGESAGGDVKIGVILVGDENEGYTYAHIEGIKEAAEACNISEDQIIWKYTIGEDETCADAAADLADQGCTAIFSNSYGHQSYMQSAAEQYPDVTFVACTGDTAAASGLPNFKNAFTKVYESRYVAGVVAGMKIAELDANGEIPKKSIDKDGNVKIGYVGAYPYAEVVSGYTAFFLGIKSVYEDVAMEVTYTNSWFDITKEGEAANSLMSDGCLIIGQHADSTGAPAAVQAAYDKGETVFSVGYNIDMLSVAPQAALTSATNVWGTYYTMAFNCLLNGEDIPVNYAAGYNDNGVAITALGESCAEGTQEKVDEIIAGIKDGSIKVFDVTAFTAPEGDFYKVDADGHLTSCFALDTDGDFVPDSDEAIVDGAFVESELRSAPYFQIRIDGITELN